MGLVQASQFLIFQSGQRGPIQWWNLRDGSLNSGGKNFVTYFVTQPCHASWCKCSIRFVARSFCGPQVNLQVELFSRKSIRSRTCLGESNINAPVPQTGASQSRSGKKPNYSVDKGEYGAVRRRFIGHLENNKAAVVMRCGSVAAEFICRTKNSGRNVLR